jgi:DNA repair protein RadD
MELRAYQKQAVAAVWDHIRTRDDNPVIVIPTGGGKTPAAATLARDTVKWGGRVLMLAHVRELLTQAVEKLSVVAPDINFGVYSAGLNSRELGYPVTVAGIQSVYNKADQLGHIDIVIADECHRWPVEGEGMYRTLYAGLKTINPKVRIIGMTATAFRTGTGLLCGPDNIFNTIAYEVGVKELIVQGYLSKIISKTTRTGKLIDTSKFHIRAGEYVQEEVEAAMVDEERVAMALLELGEKTGDRHSVLIFASSVAHGEMIVRIMKDYDFPGEIGFVTGETDGDERTDIVHLFKSKKIRYLVNVSVFTEGFDAPNVDCVVLLRPTASPGLYYQMVGRGFRLAEGKVNCLVLDYGGNVLRHGPVDMVAPSSRKGAGGEGKAPAKECPECQSVIAAGYGKCPDCGFEFPVRGSGHDEQAGEAPILSEPEVLEVEDVKYAYHKKADKPTPTMRVDYNAGNLDLASVSEWVCFEHQGYARDKAVLWWQQRTQLPVPTTIGEAVAIANRGELLEPRSITFQKEGKYKRVLAYHDLSEKVERDIPF